MPVGYLNKAHCKVQVILLFTNFELHNNSVKINVVRLPVCFLGSYNLPMALMLSIFI